MVYLSIMAVLAMCCWFLDGPTAEWQMEEKKQERVGGGTMLDLDPDLGRLDLDQKGKIRDH